MKQSLKQDVRSSVRGNQAGRLSARAFSTKPLADSGLSDFAATLQDAQVAITEGLRAAQNLL